MIELEAKCPTCGDTLQVVEPVAVVKRRGIKMKQIECTTCQYFGFIRL